MEEEVSKTKRTPRKAKLPLTVEAAEEKILSKLAKAGTKGTPAAYGKATGVEAVTYAEALSILTGEDRRAVFADRRGAKARFYLWMHRPILPTAESLAVKVLAFARGEHPRVHSAATFAKKLKLTKEEKPLLPDALKVLSSQGQLTALAFAPAAKSQEIFAVTAAFHVPSSGPAASSQPEAFDLAMLKPAYDALVTQSGFPAVPIASLQKTARVPMEALKRLLRQERDAGNVVLSIGDWSIASDEERLGVIEMHGRNYLQVRWQE